MSEKDESTLDTITHLKQNGQRVFLDNGNFDLQPPLDWKVYGDSYSIPG